ncbi:unnamed protein product [Medioppia subpectinata]|uniref:Hexosyltransferase n=1 Tax=Medioppia subpectinata TaxID=1979941 RepID=A0A7R9L2R6_9ACAR|nr:unnamed protein product [Medioppia subpectinata]CAG2113259.1 unnamed protein product [Medioppia subpectinata]
MCCSKGRYFIAKNQTSEPFRPLSPSLSLVMSAKLKPVFIVANDSNIPRKCVTAMHFVSINYWSLKPKANKCSLNIFVAILSHRNHYHKRQALRHSWLQTVHQINDNHSLIKDNEELCDIRVNARFVVGAKDCPIAERFRTSPYSCRWNQLTFNPNDSRLYLQEVINGSTDSAVDTRQPYRGFSFVIRHSVVVTQLGIHRNFLSDNQNITIVLLNAQNKAYYGFTDFESIAYTSELFIGPTIAYKLTDPKSIDLLLTSQQEIQNEWNNELLRIEKSIAQEMIDNKDILLIDSIDVYRNLAEKVIQSMKFFRRVWPLDYWGKWAENDYQSPLYPTFACGSGYVLSADLVQWIVSNAHHLHRFQVYKRFVNKVTTIPISGTDNTIRTFEDKRGHF